MNKNGRAYYNEEKAQKEGRPHGTGISARTIQHPSCGLDERTQHQPTRACRGASAAPSSTISRFISGAKGTLTHEQVLKIARLFNVSTDFLLGETNIPDRKNYDIAELGLSVEAAKNLLHRARQCRGSQPAAGKRPLCRAYLPHSAVF
ncbi:MAG: hypothetical protein ACLRRU_09445 [Faecalibacterium sp.]